VHRGQEVDLLADHGAIQVKSQGEALGDGAVGNRIKVRNKSSGRIIEGTIRSAGIVEAGLP